MQLLYNILDKARYVFAALAAIAVVIAMSMQYDWAYAAAIILIIVAVITDAAKMILQRKLGIPIKRRENMFKFKKRK